MWGEKTNNIVIAEHPYITPGPCLRSTSLGERAVHPCHFSFSKDKGVEHSQFPFPSHQTPFIKILMIKSSVVKVLLFLLVSRAPKG